MTYTIKIERNEDIAFDVLIGLPEYKRWSASLDWRLPQSGNHVQADFEDDKLSIVLRQMAKAIEEEETQIRAARPVINSEEAARLTRSDEAYDRIRNQRREEWERLQEERSIQRFSEEEQ